MKHNDLGNPLAPRKNVVSFTGGNWVGVTEKRAVIGYACLYTCKLECGHEQQFITKTSASRGGVEEPAPSYMYCETCWKDPSPPRP